GSALDFILLARRAIPSSSRRLLLLLPVSGPGKRTGVSPCTTPAPRAQPPVTRGTVRRVTRAHAMGRHRGCQPLGSACTHRLALNRRDTSSGDPRCAARVHLCGTLAHPVQGVGGPFRVPGPERWLVPCRAPGRVFPLHYRVINAACPLRGPCERRFRFDPAPGSVHPVRFGGSAPAFGACVLAD